MPRLRELIGREGEAPTAETVPAGGTLSASESEGSEDVRTAATDGTGCAVDEREDAELDVRPAPTTQGDDEAEEIYAAAGEAPADAEGDEEEATERAAASSSLKLTSWNGVMAVLAANWWRPSI